MRRSGADVGFAQDADADRLAVVDERGTPLGADATVVLVVQRWLERRPGPVVVNVSTSRMVDDVAARFGCPVHRSRVGEANVLEAMTDHGAEVGGESDGGVIVLPVNPCRDSFAAMAVILEAMAVSGDSIGELRARVPRYAMVRERLLCPARDIAPSLRLIKGLFRGERFDLTDGVKVMWPDRWLLARPSTTEPGDPAGGRGPDRGGGPVAREPRPRGPQPGGVRAASRRRHARPGPRVGHESSLTRRQRREQGPGAVADAYWIRKLTPDGSCTSEDP